MNKTTWMTAIAATATFALFGCGEAVDGDDDNQGEETAQQRSGLDLDPLDDLDIGGEPDMDEVPDEIKGIVEDAFDGGDDVLWFYGEHDDSGDVETYTFRAEVEPMDHLSDDAYEEAVDILAKRNDVTGISEVPLESNGGYFGDGDYESIFNTKISYNPDADPEPEVDVDERIERIEDEIELALEDNGEDPEYDDEGRLRVHIDFDWNAEWYHHVDVFDEDEVASKTTAIDVGEDRAEDEIGEKFEDVGVELAELAGCVEHSQSIGDATATYGCEEDSIEEVTAIAEDVEQFVLVGNLDSPSSGGNGSNATDNDGPDD